MIKMNNMAERMREHCSRVYWEVDDIEENIMFMIKELPNLNVTSELLSQTEDLLGGYISATILLRSEALELAEKFYLFIIDPGVERIKLPEQEVEEILQIISDNLNDQSIKFDNFIKMLETMDKDTTTEGLLILSHESGANMLRDKGEVINSLRFLFNNYERYQYETNN
jgi:hypothetical protein